MRRLMLQIFNACIVQRIAEAKFGNFNGLRIAVVIRYCPSLSIQSLNQFRLDFGGGANILAILII
jgi:hypothetical protein